MSLLISLDAELQSAKARVGQLGEDSPEAVEARLAARAFGRALIMLEPATLAEAVVHARGLKVVLESMPLPATERPDFDRHATIVVRALSGVTECLHCLDRNSCSTDEPTGAIEALARELDTTWRAYEQTPDDRLSARGDALERAMLALPPKTLDEAAIVTEAMLAWVADFELAFGPDRAVANYSEAAEHGLAKLSAAIHRFADRPLPNDRPSMAIDAIACTRKH